MTHQELIDVTFPRSYECSRLRESQETTLPHYYFPTASTKGGHDGLLVEVRPEGGQSWIGTFAFGQVTAQSTSGIFTTPDRNRVCIVARGEGYFVNALKPTDWETVRATPIIDVRLIRVQELIVFANFTELVAYGSSGVKWRTKRLSWDGLKINEVTADCIQGEFWDIRSESIGNFVVDLSTGAHHGGIKEIGVSGLPNRMG